MSTSTDLNIETITFDYKFTCKYENFSNRLEIRETVFHPFPNSMDEWRLTLTCDLKLLTVKLHTQSIKTKSFDLKSEICFNDIFGDSVICSCRESVSELEAKDYYFLVNEELDDGYVCELMKLPERTLILKGHFVISGTKCLSLDFPQNNRFGSPKTLLADLKKLSFDKSTCDVTFMVEGRELKAHKAFLGARSPVLANMFQHDMLERNSSQVDIEDITFHVFDCFIHFLYTLEMKDDDWDTLLALYSTADKYELGDLQNKCGRILSSKLTVENVCSALIVFYEQSGTYWLSKAIDFILLNLKKVLSTEGWKTVEDYPKLPTEIFKAMV